MPPASEVAREDRPRRDPRHTHKGSHSGWLTKQKSDSAKAKWLSGSARRYFTIDFDNRTFSYARGEDQKIERSIPFSEIINAEQMTESRRRGLFGADDADFFGFAVRTCDRDIRLYAPTYADANLWVEALNAVKRLPRTDCKPSPSLPSGAGRTSASPSPSTRSTHVSSGGSDSGHPSDEDSAGDAPKTASPWSPPRAGGAPGEMSQVAGEMTLDPWGGVLGQAEVDPFAALEAFAEELGPPPAVEEAKAKTFKYSPMERRPLQDRRLSEETIEEAAPAQEAGCPPEDGAQHDARKQCAEDGREEEAAKIEAGDCLEEAQGAEPKKKRKLVKRVKKKVVRDENTEDSGEQLHPEGNQATRHQEDVAKGSQEAEHEKCVEPPQKDSQVAVQQEQHGADDGLTERQAQDLALLKRMCGGGYAAPPPAARGAHVKVTG